MRTNGRVYRPQMSTAVRQLYGRTHTDIDSTFTEGQEAIVDFTATTPFCRVAALGREEKWYSHGLSFYTNNHRYSLKHADDVFHNE